MYISQILAKNGQKLRKISERPDWEAEILLAKALKKPQAWVLTHSDYQPTKKELATFTRLLARRSHGEPLAYVLGEQEFYGLPFKVNKHVLIPRPETEKLVDLICHPSGSWDPGLNALVKFKQKNSWIPNQVWNDKEETIIIDIGTGSGVLAISIARIKNEELKIKNIKIFAIDISAKALAVAKQNAKLNKVGKDIIFLKGDLLTPLLSSRGAPRDPFKIMRHNKLEAISLRQLADRNDKIIIAANLPYLKTGLPGLTKRQKHDLSFEPRLALLAGADGLKYYRQLAEQIKELRAAYPRLDLTLYLEADPDQMNQLKKLFPAFKAKVIKDFCGRNRFLIFTSS